MFGIGYFKFLFLQYGVIVKMDFPSVLQMPRHKKKLTLSGQYYNGKLWLFQIKSF
jgi:hypothetical protein